MLNRVTERWNGLPLEVEAAFLQVCSLEWMATWVECCKEFHFSNTNLMIWPKHLQGTVYVSISQKILRWLSAHTDSLETTLHSLDNFPI